MMQERHPGLDPMEAAAAEAYGIFIPAASALAASVGFERVVNWEDAFDFAGATDACGGVTPALSTANAVHVRFCVESA